MKKEDKVCNGILPAARIGKVSEYYFSKKLKEIAQMNADGMNVINLGIGSPDLPPAPSTIEIFCREVSQPDTHGYQPYIGIAPLRTAFSEWYKKWFQVELDPNKEIQPLIGSKEGILHISMAFLNPGDGVLVPNPGYPTYSSVTKLVGAKIIEYKLSEENGWLPDFDALEELDLSGVKLMWVNYPHMPTGTPASKPLFEKLIAFGKRHNIVICNDNPYSFILNDKPLSLLSIEGAKEIAIEMNSMSKSHNMPGWRMAMVASNPTFIEWILRVKSNVDSGQFKPMQLAAAEALGYGKEWYDSINVLYKERRILAQQIMEMLGCTYNPAQTGLFLWGKVPSRYTNAEALSDELLYKAHVFATPGSVFGTQGEHYLRLSLCCNIKTLKEAIERIKKIQQ
ncbi:MAG: aminotransferase class I/II-fold pyridoxal phosphate-dependent enzyme [Bacteroidales bacterium]|nr:aminotransferase class I/II-fold pyridoxal phosphate-dependent enzyme [Bacteroidales bacterium]